MPLLAKEDVKGRVVVYSVTSCTSCAKVLAILSEIGTPYFEINLAIYPERRKDMFQRTHSRVVPQIFFNEKHIGGYHELRKLLTSGDLETVINDVLDREPPPEAPEIPADILERGDDTEFYECNCNDEACKLNSYSHSIRTASIRSSYSGENKLEIEGATPFRSRIATAYDREDEYAGICNEIKYTSGIVGTRTNYLKRYHHCFTGADFMRYMVHNKRETEEKALLIGQQLILRNFIHHITHDKNFENSKALYTFLDDSNKHALNVNNLSCKLVQPANVLSMEIRHIILNLYNDFITDNGYRVDYEGMRFSEQFKRYVSLTEELQRVDLAHITVNQKIAFFINIYNALAIHGFVVKGIPTSLFKRYFFYAHVCYLIGGYQYTLNEIENGVLRGNKRAVATLSIPFRKNDPRVGMALPECEPRVHFALNCGAKSCPPIKTYSAEYLEEELTIVTEGYLETREGIDFDINRSELYPSKIFQWYKSDFGGTNDSLIGWIISHMDSGIKLDSIKHIYYSGKYKVKFQPYNWASNSNTEP